MTTTTTTLLRRPQDTLEDVKTARNHALSFADSEISLESLEQLLGVKQAEHASLQRELDASNAALEVLLRQSRDTLRNLQQRARSAKDNFIRLESDVTDFHDEIYSPLSKHSRASTSTSTSPSSAAVNRSSPSHDYANTSANNGTLFETLQSMQARIHSLKQVKNLFEKLAKVEECSLIAKEQVKLSDIEPCLETYRELIIKVREIGQEGSTGPNNAHGGGILASAKFVVELARLTQKDLTKALDAKLLSALDALNWPGKKLEADELDYTSDNKAKAFKSAFLDLCKLEQEFSRYSLPSVVGSTSTGPSETEECSLAISALVQPLILRFRYHFDGKRQTNRLDKPEWYFAHILNALHDHSSFIRHDIQSLLSSSSSSREEGGVSNIDAMTDFVTALLKPLYRKIRATIPQLLEMPAVLAHTLYQALQFDRSIRDLYAYTPRMKDGSAKEWKGTADLVLGNQAWFEGWKESERKFVEDKFFEIISSAEAWHIAEYYTPSTSNGVRPTNSALRVRDLFDQVTDRYRPLPSFSHRLPFFSDIQLNLLDSYLQRISSATDAFETLSFGLMRAVPGTLAGVEGNSARLTNGLNGLQRLVRAFVSATWMEGVCREWSEDIFFLDLWQDIREQAQSDPSIRQRCKQILEYKPSGHASISKYSSSAAGDNTTSESGLFDSFIHGFHTLSERISDLIVKHVVREVSNELKPYLGRRWDESSFPVPTAITPLNEDGPSNTATASSNWPTEISSDLISPVTVLSALLNSLSNALPALPLTRIYRQITSNIQETLITRSVFPKIWSERGGIQFRYDVENGWLTAVKDASKNKLRKPENGFRKLIDAAVLVSLPSSTSSSSSSTSSQHYSTSTSNTAGTGTAPTEIISIAKVIQVVWDDTNDAAFNEMLMKLGVRELIARKDVKAILRKRPECWR